MTLAGQRLRLAKAYLLLCLIYHCPSDQDRLFGSQFLKFKGALAEIDLQSSVTFKFPSQPGFVVLLEKWPQDGQFWKG